MKQCLLQCMYQNYQKVMGRAGQAAAHTNLSKSEELMEIDAKQVSALLLLSTTVDSPVTSHFKVDEELTITISRLVRKQMTAKPNNSSFKLSVLLLTLS